jgi:hypothetical protein
MTKLKKKIIKPSTKKDENISKTDKAAVNKAAQTGNVGLDILSQVLHLVAEKSDLVVYTDHGQGKLSIMANVPLRDEESDTVVFMPMAFQITSDIPLDLVAAAEHAGRNVRTIQRWVAEEGLPQCDLLGPKPVIWLSHLERFIENRGKRV